MKSPLRILRLVGEPARGAVFKIYPPQLSAGGRLLGSNHGEMAAQ
jgi:hypothetical protein